MVKNYYHLLGVDYDVSSADLKLAYRNLAKKYHPDVNPGDSEKEEMFKLVSEAYDILSDQNKKAAYDLTLLLGLNDLYASLEEEERRYRYARRRAYYSGNYYPPKKEPITYSKKVYAAVISLVVVAALSALIVPFGLSHYSSAYHYDKGLEYYNDHQYFAALNSLHRAIIDFGSKEIEACLLSGNILMNQYGQYSAAMEYANIGLKRASTDIEKVQLLYLKGMCMKEGGDYHNAINQFEEAKAIWPEYDSLYFQMGTIQAYHLGNYQEAKDLIDHLMVVNPSFHEAYYTRAYCNYQLGNYEDASKDITAFLSTGQTKEGEAYLMQALVADKLHHSEEACIAIKKASHHDVREAIKLKMKYCL